MTGLKHGCVLLAEHDPAWKTLAGEAENELRSLLGDCAADVRHVGSTAIDGIRAKPILDLAVALRCPPQETELAKKLAPAGYLSRPQAAIGDELFFIRTAPGNPETVTHHIHVVAQGGMAWKNYVNFCDYLNSFPEKAREYEELKLRLAALYPNDRNAYTAGKAEWIAYALRKAMVWSYLGREIDMEVDRPIGYVHRKKLYTLVYPINYGYIPGVLGGDGEELDVYLLGVDRPVECFHARVIGIVHRKNDVEDKLIAAPVGMSFTSAEMAKAIFFQEQHYDTFVEGVEERGKLF